MSTSNFDPIQSVIRSGDVIEIIKNLEGATLAEIYREADVSKSTAYHHLRTLESMGYVVENDGVYDLGLKYLDVAGYVRDQLPLYRFGREATESLAERTGELAVLTSENMGKSVYIYQIHGNNSVNYGSHLGTRLDMHASAAGKAMLAQIKPDRLDRFLNDHELFSHTHHTITQEEELRDELTRIRERGIALDDEERILGMRGVAAPIIDERRGDLLGAIAIGGSTITIDDNVFRETYPNIVKAHARSIEIPATYA